MSLMIKGINLPNKGDVICLEIYSDGSVWDKSNWESHPPKVLAIQIPKDHGRLIDADELNKSVHEWDPAYTYGRSAFTREIESAPTILKGEER